MLLCDKSLRLSLLCCLDFWQINATLQASFLPLLRRLSSIGHLRSFWSRRRIVITCQAWRAVSQLNVGPRDAAINVANLIEFIVVTTALVVVNVSHVRLLELLVYSNVALKASDGFYVLCHVELRGKVGRALLKDVKRHSLSPSLLLYATLLIDSKILLWDWHILYRGCIIVWVHAIVRR